MSDRLWFAIAAATAVLMIGFAIVWPQGFGARSPGPFGHPPIASTAAAPDQKSTAPSLAGAGKLDLDGLSTTPPPIARPAAQPGAPAGLRPSQ